MENRIDEMLKKYNLNKANSILSFLDDFRDEAEVRGYCMRVLQAYSDLKKEDWIIGIEGGDYIYSFDGHLIFITDDIWSFNLVATQPVLELLAGKMRMLKQSGL
ncbi:hypothetical protein H9N25_05800 [Pedobacter riviphilus]|uniref:Immunity protein 35 n=1 Tax=Pedobacter riviphilus TaxID=2766984 RepID=A0ABX6TNK2_9SPHI|nr:MULTISPECIES: hypothetical protein [Pedobacter]NII82168.1 hypothetical protein [Pedobacter sp. SG908]NMN36186.1 hypothetical protein [Pedobacter sp. SG918]QNR85955.1 hypothetical protein H9N25_05800 [Pedobacter riviphilus]